MKYIFKSLILISFVFFVYYLYQYDYAAIPTVKSYPLLVLSLTVLLIGFILQGEAWGRILRSYNFTTLHHDGLVSIGLSILGKYMPGKIGMIVGPSSFLAKKYSFSFIKVSCISVGYQFISIIAGLLLGVIGLFYIRSQYAMEVLCLLVAMTLFISPLLKKLCYKIPVLSKISNQITLEFKQFKEIFLWFVSFWLFWCGGFLLFSMSLYPENDQYIAIFFAFAVAGAIGILSVISPGGIGVREGIITIYLINIGFEQSVAITLAVVSRLWFLIGEVLFFILSLLIYYSSSFNKG